MSRAPVSFEQNRGQAARRVRFLARGEGYTLLLTRSDAMLRLTGPGSSGARGHPARERTLRMRFVGADHAARLVAERRIPGMANDLGEGDRSRHVIGVPSFRRVRYRSLWPGIDAVFYGSPGLEYDLIVRPGADPSAIGLAFRGARRPRVTPRGDLVVDAGGRIVRHLRPVAYQVVRGARRAVASRYVVDPDGTVRLVVASYDACRTLVIDPKLVYARRLSGIYANPGVAIAVDLDGNAYVPVNGRVLKVGPTGDIIYSTYIGGTGQAIAVDASGSAYVTGNGGSIFPASIQPPSSGNAFVAKLNPAGTALVYASRLGGDYGFAIAVDSSGSAYVAGLATASEVPLVNAFQPAPGGMADAFVTKIDPTGSALSYSTYLGGSRDEQGLGIALDAGGHAYVTGFTRSANFPTTGGATPGTANQHEIFVTKFSADGSSLEYSVDLGSGVAQDIAVDRAASAYVTGSGFVKKLTATGDGLAYSASVGAALDIAVDANGSAYVAGQGDGSPIVRPFQFEPSNAFVTRLNSAGSAVLYSGSLGAGGSRGDSVAVDEHDSAYISGYSGDGNFPDLLIARVDDSDTTPPETTVSSGPAAESSSNAARFVFESSEPGPGARLECRLDNETFATCTSPMEYSALAQGPHTFRVRAIDAFNNVDPSPAPFAWTVDSMPPDTSIGVGGPPAVTNATSATLTFSSPATGATFECRLDGVAFSSCSSPREYQGLAEGPHTFEARATDPAGNTDVSPATRSWTVDLTPPDTVLDGAPLAQSVETAPTFTFSSTEASSTFECRLDEAAYATCLSPKTLPGLSEGPHAFRVRAIDQAGNPDPTPAPHAWTIETAAPETTILTGPAALTGSSIASFTFVASEPASFECRLDAAAFTPCESPYSTPPLGAGEHAFRVRATDLSAKVDPSPAPFAWTIDLAAPLPAALAQPPDAAANLPVSPAFTWSPTSDDRAGVDHYELRIDDQPVQTFSGLLCGPTSCSTSAPAPLADGPHSWEVRALDGVGNASLSARRSFTVDAAAPLPFDLVSPADDGVTSSRRPGLSWHAAADSGIGIAGYDVVIDGAVGAAGLPATATGFAPAGDLAEGVHRWRVLARDRYGNERASSERAFTIDATAPIAAFTAAPNPTLAERTVSFDAGISSDAGSGIVRYEWDLDGNGTFERDSGAAPSASRSFAEPGVVGITLRVTDRAGLSAVAQHDQRVTSDDRVREPLGVSIDGGARFTKNRTVTIDAVWPSFANQMLVSNDGGFRQARTFAVQKATSWILDSSGAERLPKTVYVRFVRGPTPSETYTDDIVLDEIAPLLTSARVAPVKGGGAPLVRLRARDRGLAGLASVQVTNDRRHAGKYRAYRALLKLSTRPGERLSIRRKLYVRVRDKAGNVSSWRAARRTRSRG